MRDTGRSFPPAVLLVVLVPWLAAGPCASASEPSGEATAAGLLAPADTSSPRDTLRSFREAVDQVYRNLNSEQAEVRRGNRLYVRRALACLDLRGIAPSLAASRGQEAAVCLKEVLDRLDLPAEHSIPDDDEIAKNGHKRWRVPGTEIVIARVADGPREGEYLFDEETVAKSGEFFERIAHLPYRADAGSPGLHEVFVTVGGWMIPEGFVRSLPSWAHATVLGETVWQWLAAGALFAAAMVVVLAARGIAMLSVALARRGAPLWHVGAFVFPLAVIGMSILLDYALTAQVRFTGDALYASKLALRIVAFSGMIGVVVAVLKGVTELVIRWRRIKPDAIEGQLVRLGCKVVTFLVVAYLVILGADSLGMSVTPLVAGLSVSGLAFALAAQYTVENLIAGIVIFADKPVRIGDECQYGDVRGTVEQIGLRSTRIRCIDRTLVSIPNAEFAKQQLVNHGSRDRILLQHVLELPKDASAARIRGVIDRVREMLRAHPRVDGDSVRVRLVSCGGSSVNVEVFAYVLTREQSVFLDAQEDVLFRIMEIVEQTDGEHVAAAETPILRKAA